MDIYRMIARLDRVQTFRSHTKKNRGKPSKYTKKSYKTRSVTLKNNKQIQI